ncbi:amidase signature domain-containing protein [Hygrophoropsis aurantiaca]|uniref:Amidase signature domain-containing protein n=1 Tax=Hygrophoropsis aurantiaca TaxID=72124 RepID=A0ACB8A952_9AGAM|nr:amidase signature domain-containing protein [Hygrophoropsis aurantiaca]
MTFSAKIQGVTGNASYTQRAQALRDRLNAQIPASLRLSQSYLDNLPLDVTNVPVTCGLLTPFELAVTELDATAICEKIAKGELSAVETVTAFGRRAAIAHQVTACLTDFFLDEGIERAKELDEYYQREGKVIGPLHGLPISIKDHIPVKGHWGSGGFIVNTKISPDDCDMTRILRRLGAVFYVKTNQPQTIMHLESQSCYGRTLNPHNTDLSPGGSSGGESALVAMKGSPMGIGTDGGGSIRCPSAHCGIYGVRPTCYTLPTGDYISYQIGQDGYATSTGPMCNSARDLRLLLRAVYGTRPALVDPSLIPVQLTIPDLTGVQKKLRVGVMMHDGVVMPHPPMLRALRLAKAKLEASSEVEVIDYIPYKHEEGYGIVRAMYFEDGGKTVRGLLEEGGEDIHPLSEWVISPPYVKECTAIDVWKLHDRRDTLRRGYSDHWREQGCDVLLCPPFHGTASRHDTAKYWGYTAIWNILDYPGVVFPSGLKADPSVDVIQETPSPMSESDAYNHSLYDPDIFVGAPISLQVIGRRFEDGLVLAAQEIIERIIKS